MIKNEMTLPLAVETATIKATTDVGYTATDDKLEAYTIGYVPWEMIEKSMFFKSSQIGTLMGKDENNQNNYFGYTSDLSFTTLKGVPFCYSYAVNAYSASLNAYRDSNDDYVTAPWGTTSTAGIIHSYDVDTIINTTPNAIEETTGIYALFEMFVLYVPDGVDTSEGVWSTPNGENGWVTRLQEKSATIDILNLTFSVASSTDSSYMPNPVTFTEADLVDSVNGVMIKENGTTSYGGVTYHIYVHCAIKSASLYENSSMTLKNGIVQLNGIRFSDFGYISTPYYASVTPGSIVANTFTSGVIDSIDIPLPASSGYYIKTSDDSYEYFKGGNTYLNYLVSGGITDTDLKIIRSVARPVYKISGSFYVAEFNDDYVITGNLIPYAQARTWQTFINPDTNVFDYNDIPEPTPPDEDLPDSYGSDVLPDLNLSIGAIGGFITQYCLNATQVASFGSYLWANIFSTQFVESVGTMLLNDFSINPADILKYIISLRCYPFDLADVSGFNSNPDTIYFGRGVVGIPMAGIGTMDDLVATFGGENITVPRLYNDFRDYEPYTRIALNIPFCGQVELTPSEVVGKNIFITYTVDFTSGNIQANVWVGSGSDAGVDYIIGSASGTIGANIQLSASNGMDMLQKIGSTVATFVKTAGQIAAIAAMAGAVGESIDVKASEYGLSTEEVNALYSKSTANSVNAGSGISSALVSAPEASSLPVHAKTVGGGFTSFATPRAYLIVERKKYVVPPNYDHVYGKATNITTKLKEVSGFTVCRNVDLSGIPATQDELAALEALLQSGVYL